jgi:hypothetical protein
MIDRVREAVEHTGVFRDDSGRQGVLAYKVRTLTAYLREHADTSAETTSRLCRLEKDLANDGRPIPNLQYREVVGFQGFHFISDEFMNPIADEAEIEVPDQRADELSVFRGADHMAKMRICREVKDMKKQHADLERGVGRIKGTIRRRKEGRAARRRRRRPD